MNKYHILPKLWQRQLLCPVSQFLLATLLSLRLQVRAGCFGRITTAVSLDHNFRVKYFEDICVCHCSIRNTVHLVSIIHRPQADIIRYDDTVRGTARPRGKHIRRHL